MGFNEKTRQNFTELPQQNVQPGGRVYFTLPPVGLLSRLFINIKGVMNVTPGTGTAVKSDRDAWNLIKRIRLIANSGTAIFDVSGYGTYLINHLMSFGCAPDKTIFDRGVGTEVFAAGVANGNNDWLLSLQIPVAINQRDPMGLIMLQNSATNLQLEIDFNEAAGANNTIAPIVTTGNATAAFTGKVGCMMEYFTVPREKEDYPPLNVIHQWIENQDSIVSTGEYVKTMQRGNTYMRLLHYLTLDNALNTAAVDKLKIVYNQAETPYMINKPSQMALQRSRYGMDLPKGTYAHDWYMSNGVVGHGNARDFINTMMVTEFQSIIDIASGSTVPAGKSFINTLTEQLIITA